MEHPGDKKGFKPGSRPPFICECEVHLRNFLLEVLDLVQKCEIIGRPVKKSGGSIAMVVSKNGWLIMENAMKLDDLGVPLDKGERPNVLNGGDFSITIGHVST